MVFAEAELLWQQAQERQIIATGDRPEIHGSIIDGRGGTRPAFQVIPAAGRDLARVLNAGGGDGAHVAGGGTMSGSVGHDRDALGTFWAAEAGGLFVGPKMGIAGGADVPEPALHIDFRAAG